MSILVNRVMGGFYRDSVALMRAARQVEGNGVSASLMIGTESNKALLRGAALLAKDGEAAGPNDLILAIRAENAAAAESALKAAEAALEAAKPPSGTRPRTLGAAADTQGGNLALISVPGAFAGAEAHAALARGLHVLLFSDNVPLAEEVALKRLARTRGLLLMGPDCGTAHIAGVPLGFANELPRGDIGIVAASGTGLQEVSCLLARAGQGISHAIGVGGRDLSKDVGALSTLAAIDALDRDSATRHIVLISKPPAEDVARAVLKRVSESGKTFTICFLGARELDTPRNAKLAATLEDAAASALGRPLPSSGLMVTRRAGAIRGLFAGGTLAAEAQIVLLREGLPVSSNAPVPGASASAPHRILDLGADEYTAGKPHPMMDPEARDALFRAALADPAVGAILLDLVLGHGAHGDPAATIARHGPFAPGRVIASVTGTEEDPQGYARQAATLRASGVLVASSNAEAARLAAHAVR